MCNDKSLPLCSLMASTAACCAGSQLCKNPWPEKSQTKEALAQLNNWNMFSYNYIEIWLSYLPMVFLEWTSDPFTFISKFPVTPGSLISEKPMSSQAPETSHYFLIATTQRNKFALDCHWYIVMFACPVLARTFALNQLNCSLAVLAISSSSTVLNLLSKQITSKQRHKRRTDMKWHQPILSAAMDPLRAWKSVFFARWTRAVLLYAKEPWKDWARAGCEQFTNTHKWQTQCEQHQEILVFSSRGNRHLEGWLWPLLWSLGTSCYIFRH